ncbi:AraC family transcriptional regulator [Maribacter vaceletii]|uniref:AraC family transcriptional regulator n=1 Tax=Maribacter vaceletii TaxID=1206816 RepID=A0A495DTJ1_9FLAO|nr:AraC family transcriptional regulator [Maribacter vaceletii]RKR07971.1 AraC family transcriptional regulator [Maribacter vaceletii]
MINFSKLSSQEFVSTVESAELLVSYNVTNESKDYQFDNIVFGHVVNGVKNISVSNHGIFDLHPNMVVMGAAEMSAHVELPETSSIKPATCFTLEISKEKVGKILDKINEDFSMPELMEEEQNLSPVDLYYGSGGQYVLETLKQIQRLMIGNVRFKDYWIDIKIEELILCSLQSNMYRVLIDSYKNNKLLDHPMAYAIKHIKENLSSKVDINTLADKACMSKATFFRQFKHHLGTTPIKFIHEQRMKKAKGLLKNTNKSISVIGYDLGYSSPSYFTLQFERVFNISPLNYRKKTFNL